MGIIWLLLITMIHKSWKQSQIPGWREFRSKAVSLAWVDWENVRRKRSLPKVRQGRLDIALDQAAGCY